MKKLRVLVACEESQAVTIAFRNKGHEAWSCDLLPCSGGHPEWHIQYNVLLFLYDKWDLVIAHPPCDRLSNSGVRWLKERNLWDDMEAAADFFNVFVDYGKAGNRIVIENPVQHKYARERIEKYHQIIQPYQFGHTEKKTTCLWLYNMPKLKEGYNVYEEMMKLDYKDRAKVHCCSPGKDRKIIRAKTYTGIATAMAEQYGRVLELV